MYICRVIVCVFSVYVQIDCWSSFDQASAVEGWIRSGDEVAKFG